MKKNLKQPWAEFYEPGMSNQLKQNIKRFYIFWTRPTPKRGGHHEK
jgi:hypothetical protein